MNTGAVSSSSKTDASFSAHRLVMQEQAAMENRERHRDAPIVALRLAENLRPRLAAELLFELGERVVSQKERVTFCRQSRIRFRPFVDLPCHVDPVVRSPLTLNVAVAVILSSNGTAMS